MKEGWFSNMPSDSKLESVEIHGETYILCDPFHMDGGTEYYLKFKDGTAQLFQLVAETPMVKK